MDVSIVRGLINPLVERGFTTSAGVRLSDGQRLFAIFEERSRRIVVVAHPVRTGNMNGVTLSPWTAARPPRAGDLLDELVDPRNVEKLRSARQLLDEGAP
jgi:hypothetical protein